MQSPRPPQKPRRWLRATVAVATWVVLIVTAAVWGVLQWGDEWWPATLIMFSPRWVWLAPPIVMVLVSAIARRRSLIPATIALGLAVWPIMGLCLPWRTWLETAPPAEFKLRILTCNMHYGKTDPRLLDSLVAELRPDVVALQEWRDSAKSNEMSKPEWHTHRAGALFLASRHPILDMERLGPDSSNPKGLAARYELVTPNGSVQVFSLHLESPREGLDQVAGQGSNGKQRLEANTARRREQSEYLASQAARFAGPRLIAGDFNTPPESVLFDTVWTGNRDAFAEAGLGWGWTFFNRYTSVRIDHILVDGSGKILRCWVAPDVGSPHRPVIADVSWPSRN